MAALVYIVLLLGLTGHSSATYCVCKDGVSDAALQKAIDFACGAGADCTPILENGACYNPNTIEDHCNWAVNSYFQNKGQTQLNCDDVFEGAATQTQTTPTPATKSSSSCVYPSNDHLDLSNKPVAAIVIACIVVVYLLVSSGGGEKKTMKAPGRNQRINRRDFERDTASYFKNLGKK